MALSLNDILIWCEEEGKEFWQYMLYDDMRERGITMEESFHQMEDTFDAMCHTIKTYKIERMSASGLVGSDGGILEKYQNESEENLNKQGKKPALCGSFMADAMVIALKMAESNACMRRIVAAPTAGLHFTKELLAKAEAKGIKIAYVTLHVGIGTFRPVKEDDITDHLMHSEYCVIPQETADLINTTKKNGGRVICVGTTSCRTLESWAAEDGTMKASAGWTNIFIYPGYRFKVMDALITNYHLPESTLIMLVSALAGRENVLNAYEEAVRERYRFFSFGDAMFIH